MRGHAENEPTQSVVTNGDPKPCFLLPSSTSLRGPGAGGGNFGIDEDLVSCVSSDDEFQSCFGEEVEVEAEAPVALSDAPLFAAIGVDTTENVPSRVNAENEPPKVGAVGGDSQVPRVGSAPPPDASGSGGRFNGVITAIREQFGLSQAHARLLSTAAAGCPDTDSTVPPDRVRGVFPLPYLVGERASPGATLRAGARRKQVGRCRAVSKTNLVIGLLNLLFGGAECLTGGLTTRAGAAQLSALSRVQRTAQGWDFSADVTAAEELAGQPLVGYALDQELHAAVDTVPDLVKLPGRVGSAQLLDLLPPELAERYAEESRVVRGGIHDEAAACLRHRAFMSPSLRDEEVFHVLVKRLYDSGMLVELDAVRERIGLFTVSRPDGLQRLVVDPRPSNAAWGDPPPVRLTAGPLLARQLQRGRQPGSVMRPVGQGSAALMKSDLSDFYYNLRIPSWMSRWFALPAVPGWLVGKPEQALVDVGFGVLPMGSSHAVVLAQEAHLEILRRAGLPFDRRLVDGEPLVAPGPFFVVQIDDLVIGAPETSDRATAEAWLDVALAAYAEAGLPVAEHKVERDARKALGMELAPSRCSVGAPAVKRARVTGALLAVAQWSAAPSRLLENLLGHCTFAFLFRRSGLAAFGAVFGHIRVGEDAGRPLEARALSARCRWELITAAALLAFATVDLAAPVAQTVLASDASPWGYGVCRTEAPAELVSEALRFAELRGEHVALDGSRARRPAQDDRVAEHRPLAPGWDGIEWRTCFAHAWRSGAMVQAVGELHAAELACEYAARRVDLHGSLLLELLDARAALGALAKGRSSAWPFLRILRRVAALSFATGLEFCPRWISSEEQPADAASRWFQRGAGRDWKRGKRLGEADRPGPPRRRPLRGKKLALPTLVSYLVAFLRFSAWCELTGWAARVPDVPALELALIEWMEELHEDGVGAYIGNCAFGAIRVLSRRIHGELVDARALLSDWNGIGHAAHWPPIPYPLLFLLAEDQLQRGDIGCALAFLLAFTGLLRISEVAGLCVGDVVFPEDPRFWGVAYVVLALAHTKTGDDLSAEVRASWLWPMLRAWVRSKAPGGRNARLFPSAPELRAALHVSLAALGVGHVGFVFHSFRAGGALYLLNCEVELVEVLRRGRWRRPESARPYLQRLRALAAGRALPPVLLARGAVFAAEPRRLLAPWFG